MLRPPSNPRLLASLPEQRTGGGAAPEPPHRCALTAQRRTVVVTRIGRADQAAAGPAEALPLPSVGELAHNVGNLREEDHPEELGGLLDGLPELRGAVLH